MTQRAIPAQVTEDYRPEPSPERVRVALVAGSGSPATDDLNRLLRRRLLVSTLIAAVALGAYFGQMLMFLWVVIQSGRIHEPGVSSWAWWATSLRGVPAVASAGMVLLLWRRPPSSVRGLRAIEVSLVGLFAAILLADDVVAYGRDLLRDPARDVVEVRWLYAATYTLSSTLLWVCLITWYGTLIPNTWRRSAVVVGSLTLSPIVLFAVQAFWLRPLPEDISPSTLLINRSIFTGIAAAVAVFSSSRIEFLRQQAAEARKLGQYVLKEKLGAGGMGEVYRAEHVLLRRPCALKVIRPERAGDPKNLLRFEREVRVTATLTHPNTVQIYDYGHAQDGTFYYVMEYLPGLTLDEIVCRHGPLPPGRAAHFLRQVCAALAEAHARGLTHRDVKPGNVMVCERGGVRDVVKLLDFGLVLAPKDDPDGATLTREGAVAGTPAFMSPEQAGGEDGIDPRSDLYSVGALAYFLLTGKPPFADRSAARMLAAHLYEPPGALPAAVPTDLAAVVMRCLAKAPSERWPDAASLEAALTELAVSRWTAEDARAWWARVGSDRETGPVLATATWAEPGAAADPAS